MSATDYNQSIIDEFRAGDGAAHAMTCDPSLSFL
jgi:hypothetical protein